MAKIATTIPFVITHIAVDRTITFSIQILCFKIEIIFLTDIIFAETTNKMPAIVGILIFTINFAKTAKKIRMNTECNIPDIGDFAPELTLTMVLAVVPATGRQPNNGNTKFAIPCPNNSVFDLCFVLAILSAIVADKRASIPAKKAIVRAGIMY